jgi:hypothetical protein
MSRSEAIRAALAHFAALEGGDELIIHAMPARKKYLDLLP